MSVTSDQQFISSSSSLPDLNSATTCGSRSHPWRLEAPDGQRINVSLIDFAAGPSSTTQARDVTCRQYGYVVEKSSKKNVSICSTIAGERATGGGAMIERERSVYTSDASAVSIVLTTSTSDVHNFLIRTSGE